MLWHVDNDDDVDVTGLAMPMLTLLCSLKKDWFVVTLYVLYKSQILGGGNEPTF